jgi:cysteine-rich repeat protein
MIESTLKPAQTPEKKQHWLIWILLLVVIGAAAVIVYFAQSGQFFKGQAGLPISSGPTFYVVQERTAYHCDLANAPIGSQNCPFEGLQDAYNHIKTIPNINPVELRLASGAYFLQERMTFKDTRVNIHGGYDMSSFVNQNLNNPSIFHGAIKVENSNGGISNLITFNGGRVDIPFIEVDNSGPDGKSFNISNIIANNVGFPSIIKFSTGSSNDQGVIQNMVITQARADNGAVINAPGNGDMLIRNNYIASSYATPKGIIYAEDNVKIVNNAIVDTLGGNETGGIYTPSAVNIVGGADAKLVNNTFADNAFSGSVVKQDSEDDYMLISNNLIIGNKHMFNVPDLSFQAARGNHWDVSKPNPGSGETYPIYGINVTYNDKCDPKLKDEATRNPFDPNDYKLGSGSDCIDSGIQSAAILNLVSPDYFGLERPVGQNIDPGFSEFKIEFLLAPIEMQMLQIGDDDGIPSVLDGIRIPGGIFREPFTFAECGNGTLETTEECDDGNTANGDGCSSTCTEEPVEECGNGILEAGEQCDDGNVANNDGCDSQCQNETSVTEECGNGILEAGEQCDDGNVANNDGCDSQCQNEASVTEECGNGILEAGEQCDDGNTVDNDGCDQFCFYENPDPDIDLCLNISGNQEVIPTGYEQIGSNCYPIEEEGVACGEWKDVSDSDPEFDIWVWLCEREILKGHKDGTLRPNDLLTRAELLALAFRASDYENEYEVDEYASYCFVDVDDEWFAKYTCTAEDLGFVEGYAGNIFDPARKVILAEGLKMYLGALDEPFTINSDPDEWYFDMLYDAEDDGFLPYTLTDPQVVGPIELTRRKAANMLYRIMIYR